MMRKIKRISLIISFVVLFACQCFGATYTATQDGAWNTDATWGGGGHPSANDDVANINAYAVSYDAGDSAVTWGNVTVTTGSLTFPTNANSTMSFNATGVLAIGAAGTLNIGTSTSSPIGASYHCRIYWPQGASARNVFTVANGGIVNGYGDPAFYGSAPTADLDSDWTTGQTLYVAGDYTAKWAAGQKFWIHKNGTYSNYTTDSEIFTIGSIGSYDAGNDKTPIVISEAGPSGTYTAVNGTSGWQSKLLMLSRNVEFADPGTTLTVYYYNTYTERIRGAFTQTGTNGKVNFNNVFLYGWDRVSSVSMAVNIIYDGCAFVGNSNVVLYAFGGLIKNSFLISNSQCMYDARNIISQSNYFGANVTTIAQISGSTSTASNFIGNSTVSTLQLGVVNFHDCKFICNNAVFANTYGACISKNSDFWLNSEIDVQTGAYYSNDVLENCEIAGVKRALRVYEKVGNFLPLQTGETHWQSPDSGNSWILEATPTSSVGTGDFNKMVLSPHKEMAVYCPSGANTLTFKICPGFPGSPPTHDWDPDLSEADIYIKVRYLTDTGNETAETQTTTATFTDGSWQNLSVTFTTGQAGVAYFNLYITRYDDSGDLILIDPVWTLS